MPLSDSPAPAPVTDLFGIQSRTVTLALAHLGFVYVVVTVGAGLDIRGLAPWSAIAGAFVVLMADLMAVVRIAGDPFPMRAGLGVTAVMLAGTALSWWSTPMETFDVLQLQSPLIAGAAILVLLALRGRPMTAWVGTLLMSASAGVWSVQHGRGLVSGITFTAWTYPTMVLATLFVLMLRPMARRIRVLREQAVVMAAEDAAARAGTEEHDRQLIHLDQAARPILHRVATGHEFTDAEVTHAHLVEDDLRDGLRAQGWYLSRVREAVWRARERGVSVVLLDDSGHHDTDIAHTDLEDVLVGLLHGLSSGRVTARVGPPGRSTFATILVDSDGVVERYDCAADGTVSVVEQIGR
ncbi:hypothetical protein ACIGKQ_13820 [Gordonia sp. NPDC062954]|uniref:hypothetical protein n=1 Tax=Gordonia sp. NPDC062954 TaxID=3364003 RepID=UPI0037C75C4D